MYSILFCHLLRICVVHSQACTRTQTLREKANKNGVYLDYHFAQDCVPCYVLTSVSLNLPVALPKCCTKGQVVNNSTKPHSLLSVPQEREMDCEREALGFLLSTALSSWVIFISLIGVLKLKYSKSFFDLDSQTPGISGSDLPVPMCKTCSTRYAEVLRCKCSDLFHLPLPIPLWAQTFLHSWWEFNVYFELTEMRTELG